MTDPNHKCDKCETFVCNTCGKTVVIHDVERHVREDHNGV